MNQLTWHFGFAHPDAAIKLDTTGWLIQNDQSKLADDYAENVIKHLQRLLVNKKKGKKKKLRNLIRELESALGLEEYDLIFKDETKFTEEATLRLRQLFRGHILELKEADWFKHYLLSKELRIETKCLAGLFDYDNWKAMQEWRRKLLVATGVTICPYCDRQYITSFDSDGNIKKSSNLKTLATLDHFYVKSRYPLFALSLFNFIPACYGCNSVIRGNQDLKLYPYQFGFDQITHFAVRPQIPKDQPPAFLTDLLVDFILEKDDVSFKLEQSLFEHLPNSVRKEDVQNDISILRLNEVYAVHQDYVRELMIIRRFYENSEYRSAISDLLGKAIGTEDIAYPVTIEKLRSFLIGGDWLHNPEEASIPSRRPLAKLTNAILQDDYTLLFPEKIQKNEINNTL